VNIVIKPSKFLFLLWDTAFAHIRAFLFLSYHLFIGMERGRLIEAAPQRAISDSTTLH